MNEAEWHRSHYGANIPLLLGGGRANLHGGVVDYHAVEGDVWIT